MEQQEQNRLQGTFLEFNDNNTQQREAYTTGIMNLIYSKGTKEAVYQMLQSGDPKTVLPKAVSMVNDRMKTAIKDKGKDVDLGTQVHGVVFTTMELANLGTAAGFFKLGEQDMPPLIQESLKEYVHSGLKDGSIDPIEAQKAAESLMTPEQREQAQSIAAQKGFPQEPGVTAAMEKYAGMKVSKERQKYMQRMQQMNKRYMDSQTQAEPQQGAMQQVQGGTV